MMYRAVRAGRVVRRLDGWKATGLLIVAVSGVLMAHLVFLAAMAVAG